MKKTLMLKKNYEFKYVLNNGKYYSGEYIEAFVKKNNSNESKIGIAIGVKIAKAYKRNYIKRIIRESYKEYEDNLKDGFRIVFLWKKKVDPQKATFKNVKEDMEKILVKSGLLSL